MNPKFLYWIVDGGERFEDLGVDEKELLEFILRKGAKGVDCIHLSLYRIQ
jgi:hypothetical protein